MPPFAPHAFLSVLNAVLPREVDDRFSCTLYEALQSTSSWDLYDQIRLYGFDSAQISEQLQHLAYVKEQTMKARQNARNFIRDQLIVARAEKIARVHCSYYFDYTDRRALFVRFNTFALDKIPQPDRDKIKVLLDKSIAAQEAMLNRRCQHVPYLQAFARNRDSAQAFRELRPFISDAPQDGMYSCRMCLQPLVCEHEIEAREMLETAASVGKDPEYKAQRRIVNKYALVSQQFSGGDSTTESLYTYYCKYCGGELGKSAEAVQAGRITWTSGPREIYDNERMLFTFVASTVRSYARPTTIPIGLRAVSALLFDAAKPTLLKLLRREKAAETPRMRYFCTIYALAGLLALNVSKIKSSKSILNTTGEATSSQLKREFVAAMKIVHANESFKRLGVNLEKIKASLVAAFRLMNGAISNETMPLQTTSARDRLIYDIRSCPLASYATAMYRRVLGVDLDALFARKKTDRPKAGALFEKIFLPEFLEHAGGDGDRARYILESYLDVVEIARRIHGQQPDEKETAATLQRRNFATAFEARLREASRLRRCVPVSAENSRDHDFALDSEQIAFCLNKDASVRMHRWAPSRGSDGQLELVCRYCGLNIAGASKKNDAAIRNNLYEQMHRASFFEYYALACPVEQAHAFEPDGGGCKQCGVTDEQLEAQDASYYKKYLPAYHKRRDDVASNMLSTIRAIVSLPELPIEEEDNADKKELTEEDTQTDPLQLESLVHVSSLAKLHGVPNLNMLTKETNNLPQAESYVRMLYSHYLYVKNLSFDTPEHPDPTFSEFVRQNYFDGAQPKQGIQLGTLPDYPTSKNEKVARAHFSLSLPFSLALAFRCQGTSSYSLSALSFPR
ncbi:hypothetical protein L917_21734 [Phytophthora nicotianae]|uniref:Uncharacterized protein n=1 Tax=Phytophthora nicotianae TaxID=4792 RepID=W2JYR9_PHYNI|nr:hypothetical protein L917_21734 [Phytophthora nicotianae]